MTEHTTVHGVRETVTLTPDIIEEYMQTLQSRGLTRDTLITYRRNLDLLYASLSEEKEIGRGTLDELSQQMQEAGYAPQSINGVLTVANGLLRHCGRMEFQSVHRPLLSQRVQRSAQIQGEIHRQDAQGDPRPGEQEGGTGKGQGRYCGIERNKAQGGCKEG